MAAAGILGRVEEAGPIDRLRDLFLSSRDADLSGLRPIVARSWYRSRAAGVDAEHDRGFLEEGRVDEHTVLAAAPHLQNLDEIASDMGGYVSLTSPNGSLVRPDYLRDEEGFPVGYSLLEESVGSNGEGLALEEGRGVWLAPEEHFREDMRGNWCFASLIRDPFHNRVRAVIGLTFPANRVRGLEPSTTLLMLEGIASRIEREIEIRTSSREQTLLSEYLTITRRRGSAAVVALDGKNTLMNAAATASLDDADFSIVSGYAKAVMTSGESLSSEVVLPGAGTATLEVSPVDLSNTSRGAVVVVRPHRAHPKGARSGAPASEARSNENENETEASVRPLFDGVSGELRRTVSRIARAIEQRRSVTILGEAGSGKRRIADAIASSTGSIVEYDAQKRMSDGPALRDALRRIATEPPEVFLIEGADSLSEIEAFEITKYAKQGSSTRLILTAVRHTDATQQLAEAYGAMELATVPLRNRREDIPMIATSIAKQLGSRRLSRRLLAALTDADWPRNIDQLAAIVTNAVERASGGEASVDDLPQAFHRALTNGRLSRLEDAELSELRSALQEAHGNRRLAAETLQIGRSTLYRRMDYFRSRGFEL